MANHNIVKLSERRKAAEAEKKRLQQEAEARRRPTMAGDRNRVLGLVITAVVIAFVLFGGQILDRLF